MKTKRQVMTWYWYAARSNEILLDLDTPLAVTYAGLALKRTSRRKFLQVQNFYFYESFSKGYHLIVVLKNELPANERALWAMKLFSDKTRGIYTLMRIARGLTNPDLLIVSQPYLDWRDPDAVCQCKGKHKPRRITEHCPVLAKWHGREAGAEYFPRNRDRKPRHKGRAPKLPIGKVPLSRILNF